MTCCLHPERARNLLSSPLKVDDAAAKCEDLRDDIKSLASHLKDERGTEAAERARLAQLEDALLQQVPPTTHVHIYIYTYIYMYTYTYMYICVCI